MFNEDYKELLEILSARDVRFLVVGAYAVGVHGIPRATGDFDIWVDANSENAAKVYQALCDFGAPKDQFTPDDFSAEGIVYQIGVVPRRIDILTQISGVSFSEAWPHRLEIDLDGLLIPVIGIDELIKNKKATGREKDHLDVKLLQESVKRNG